VLGQNYVVIKWNWIFLLINAKNVGVRTDGEAF